MRTTTTASLWAAILLLSAGTCTAQGVPTATQDIVPDYQQVLSEYERAAASARRPGDEHIGCTALKTELETIVADEAFKAYFEAAGAAAQRDYALMHNAQAAMMAGVPAANVPVTQQSMAERAQQQARQMDVLAALMPKILRAQRVNELAMLKACDWLTESGVAMPGMAEPAAVQE